MSQHHLLLNHGSQSQICSSDILSSQHAAEYNHWLSTMACASEIYDPPCYERCIGRRNFHNEQSYPCSSQRGLPSRSPGHEQYAWPEPFGMSLSGCAAMMHDCGAFPYEMRNNLIGRMGDSSYMRGMQEVCEEAYKESLVKQPNLNQHLSMTMDNKDWSSTMRHLDFGNEYLTEENFEHDSIDIDELDLDCNIVSTLCGLEEVLSRLI